MQSTATLREKKKPESKLGGAVPSRTEKPPVENEAMKVIRGELETAVDLLEGRVGPDPLDDTFLILLGRDPPLISREFLKFEKGSEVIPLPPKGEAFRDDLEHYAKKNQGLIEKQLEGEKTKEEPSYIDIQVLEERNIVIITNTRYLPENMRKKASKLATSLKQILSSGNEEHMLTAFSCWEELKFSMEQYSVHKAMAGQAISMNKVEFAEITAEISKTYGAISGEMLDRIATLAEGKSLSQASMLATTPMQKRLEKLQTKAADMQMEEATRTFTGIDAIERIERGIGLGLYSNIEIVIYKQISEELKAALGRVKGFSKTALSRISLEGYDGISGWQKKEVERAIGLVAHLECIAWKVDLSDRVHALKGKVRGARAGMGRIISSQHIPMNQLTVQSRKDMQRLGKRAREHLSYLKSFINHADDLTKEEKGKYSEKIDQMSKDIVKFQVPGEFSSTSKKLTSMLESVEQLLGERHLERIAEDEQNPWNVRTTAYTKLYVLRHSLEIIGASAAIGGAAGGISTRNPAGAWAGAKIGASAGGVIVGFAGAFLTVDAMQRYFSGTGDPEQALEDMRLGATYMLFGLGGGPIAAVSTPIKLLMGGGAALASSVLMYEDIKRGNYWEIPADVAYLAIGAVAFVRVAGGAFRAVRLANPLKSTMVIANSSGVARIAVKAGQKLESISTRALQVGYTPTWIGLNAAFGGLSQWHNISTAIENGNYGIALSYLNRGFAEVTRGMVGFDFALFGVAGSTLKAGAAPVARYFRVAVPAAHARAVNLLSSEGLYERISDLARKAGAKTFQPETNAQILELAFASEGKVSAEYVQVTLGLESRAAASTISTEINTSWRTARRILSKGKAAGKAAWNKVGRNMKQIAKTRAARLAAQGAKGAVLIGAVGYMEFENIESQKLATELNSLINKSEAQFLNYLLASPLPEFGTSQLEMGKIVKAMGLVNSISDDVDDGVHPLALQLELGGDIEKRKRLLLSGAVSLMMEGHDVTDENLSALMSEMGSLFTSTGIELRVHTPVGTLALMGSILLDEGPEKFADAYASISRNAPEEQYLDYIVSSYYCASTLGRSVGWASDVSFGVFQAFVDNDMEGKVLGWSLVRTFQELGGKQHSQEEIIATAKQARWNVTTGAFAREE